IQAGHADEVPDVHVTRRRFRARVEGAEHRQRTDRLCQSAFDGFDARDECGTDGPEATAENTEAPFWGADIRPCVGHKRFRGVISAATTFIINSDPGSR